MRRTVVLSVLAGLLAGVVTTASVSAVVGEPIIAGQRNTSGTSQTKLWSAANNSTLKVVNNLAGTPALWLEVREGSPPLRVTSQVKVDNLNADLLDGLSSDAFAGAIHAHPEYAAASHSHESSPVTVGPAGFHGIGRLLDWTHEMDYVQSAVATSVYGRMVAPVELPHGAVLIGMSARLADSIDTGEVRLYLMRAHLLETYPEAVDGIVCRAVFIIETGSTETPGLHTAEDTTVDPPTVCTDNPFLADDYAIVDNRTWSYYLMLEFERTTGLAQDLRLHSADIHFNMP